MWDESHRPKVIVFSHTPTNEELRTEYEKLKISGNVGEVIVMVDNEKPNTKTTVKSIPIPILNNYKPCIFGPLADGIENRRNRRKKERKNK